MTSIPQTAHGSVVVQNLGLTCLMWDDIATRKTLRTKTHVSITMKPLHVR